MTLAIHSLLVFLGVAVSDWFWAAYIKHTAGVNPMKASLAAVGITLCSALVVLEYTQDRRMLLPACLGAFVGTYLPLCLHAKD